MAAMKIRTALPADAGALLLMMRELARFEDYLRHFCVTEADLLERGLDPDGLRQFTALVAERDDGVLAGYALVYTVPYTYDLRPNLMLKELYVSAGARNTGVGHALMTAVIELGRRLGCARLKWDVLASNAPAQAFYRALGGGHDARWQGWLLAV